MLNNIDLQKKIMLRAELKWAICINLQFTVVNCVVIMWSWEDVFICELLTHILLITSYEVCPCFIKVFSSILQYHTVFLKKGRLNLKPVQARVLKKSIYLICALYVFFYIQQNNTNKEYNAAFLNNANFWGNINWSIHAENVSFIMYVGC